MNKVKVWMKITQDALELPEIVADSAAELARICGTTRNAVSSAASHARLNGIKSSYISVEVDLDEDDQDDAGGPGA